jgi:hypothetical protein
MILFYLPDDVVNAHLQSRRLKANIHGAMYPSVAQANHSKPI